MYSSELGFDVVSDSSQNSGVGAVTGMNMSRWVGGLMSGENKNGKQHRNSNQVEIKVEGNDDREGFEPLPPMETDGKTKGDIAKDLRDKGEEQAVLVGGTEGMKNKNDKNIEVTHPPVSGVRNQSQERGIMDAVKLHTAVQTGKNNDKHGGTVTQLGGAHKRKQTRRRHTHRSKKNKTRRMNHKNTNLKNKIGIKRNKKRHRSSKKKSTKKSNHHTRKNQTNRKNKTRKNRK